MSKPAPGEDRWDLAGWAHYQLITPRCQSNAEVAVDFAYFGTSVVSLLALSLLLWKILRKRCQQIASPSSASSTSSTSFHHGSSLSLAQLIEQNVINIAMTAILYHVTDIVYNLDCRAPPIIFLIDNIKNDEYDLFHETTVIYLMVKDGFALMSLWWHSTLAYIVYGFLVLKLSATSLNRRRLPLFFGAAFLITLSRLILFMELRQDILGFYITKYVYELFLVPTALICMIRWYVLAAFTLYGQHHGLDRLGLHGGGNTAPPTILPIVHQPSREEQSSSGPSPASLNSTTSISMPSFHRNQTLINRLMRISLSVAVIWLLILVLDMIVWWRYCLDGERTVAAGVGYGILYRLIGLVDAIILSDVCSWCSQTSPSRLARPLLQQLSTLPVSQRRNPSKLGGRGISLSVLNSMYGPTPTKEEEVERLTAVAERMNDRKIQSQKQLKSLQLFVSTWNMGGVDGQALEMAHQGGAMGGSGKGKSLLAKWIPLGYDLYVIGVQECQCLGKFRDVVHSYLGGSANYSLFSAEIGDATILHGMIAINMFVRTTDVTTGAFRLHEGTVTRVANGVTLGPMGRMANKGIVGLSLRYHDTNLAIITAHFASDSKGRNRLEKRNKDACTTLRELSLVWDSLGWNVHNQHHQTIMLGDLNYRCQGDCEEVLQRISQSARLSQSQVLLDSTTTTTFPSSSFDDGQEGIAEGKVPSTVEGGGGQSSSGLNWRTVAYRRLYQLHSLQTSPSLSLLPQSMSSIPVQEMMPQQQGRSCEAIPFPGPCPPTLLPTVVPSSLSNSSGGEEGGEGGLPTLLLPAPQQIHSMPNYATSSYLYVSDLSNGSGFVGGSTSNVGGFIPLSYSTTGTTALTGGSASYMGGSYTSTMESIPGATSGVAGALVDNPTSHLAAAAEKGGGEEGRGSTNPITLSEQASEPRTTPRGINNCPPPSSTSPVVDSKGIIWGWVPLLDELNQSMRERLVFWGFKEGVITFPPSYRWRRNGLAGAGRAEGGGIREVDSPENGPVVKFRSVEREEEEDVERGRIERPQQPLSPITPTASYASSGSRGKGGGGTGGAKTGETLAHDFTDSERLAVAYTLSVSDNPYKATSSRRVPSYTDRILTHSLPGKAPFLRWKAYDMADEVELSDHRPVSAAMEMIVDSSIRGFWKEKRNSLSSSSTSLVGRVTPTRNEKAQMPQLVEVDDEDARHQSNSNISNVVSTIPAVPSSQPLFRPLEQDMAVFTIKLVDPKIVWVDGGEKNLDAAAASPSMLMEGSASISLPAPALRGGGSRGSGSGSNGRGSHMGSTLSSLGTGIISGFAGGGGGVKPHEATILFPLISEDPVADERQASHLTEAMPFTLKQVSTFPFRNEATTSSCRWQYVRWSSFPYKFQMVASRRFSEHMLIKITGQQGQDLGQVVIPISLGLVDNHQPPPPDPSSPSHHLKPSPSNNSNNNDRSISMSSFIPPSILPRNRSINSSRVFAKETSFVRPAGQKLTFPLTSGGQFKGWLTLTLKVKVRDLRAPNRSFRERSLVRFGSQIGR